VLIVINHQNIGNIPLVDNLSNALKMKLLTAPIIEIGRMLDYDLVQKR
jgi:hypothetical protein